VLTEHPVEGAHAPFEQENARRSVQALLEGLDDDKRAAFVLVEVEGFTAAEAAELLEIPLGTVYSRVRAAWARLRLAASEDLEVASMRTTMEPERRHTLQRALLAGCLPTAQAVGTATTGGVLGWLWGVMGAGLLAAGIGIGTEPHVPAEPAVVVQPAPEPVRAPTKPSTTPVPQRASAPVPAPEPAEAEAKPSVPKHRTKVPTSTPPEPEVSRPLNTLAEEAKLIRRAKEHVRDGELDAALEVIGEHERRFPEGQLVDEREAVRQRLDGMQP
jgi:hypothetical protein